MIWYSNIYADEECQDKFKMHKWRLEHGSVKKDLYLITLSTAEKMQLDIVESIQLKQPDLRKRLPMIVGMASSYGNALELVVKITDEVYRNTGTGNIRAYFTNK